MLGNEKKFYKLEYVEPIEHFNSVTESVNWDNAIVPNATDFNGTLMDLFEISSFANINSTLTDPKFPGITTTAATANYIFQLTGVSESSENVNMGTVSDLLGGSSSTSAIALQPFFQTLTVSFSSEGFTTFNTSATSAKEVFMHNYVVMDRGFFTKSLEVFDSQGDTLPVILDNNRAFQYIAEGKDFIVDTEYFDPDGLIDFIEISAFIDAVADANKIKKWTFDTNGADDDKIQIIKSLDGIFDLTSNAPNRIIKLTVKLVDTNSNTYEIQSEFLKLVQFPFFPNDFKINAIIQNKKVGEHPKGTIIVRDIAPETLRKINFAIYRAGVGNPDTSDFNKVFFKGQDFICAGFDCSFDFSIDEWVFERAANYQLTVWAALTTESADWNSIITAKTLSFPVAFRVFETAKILQAVERNAGDYRPEEEINLVMQLRDEDFSNLFNDLRVFITPFRCSDESSACTSMDINFLADNFLYDPATGYNYYFFRELFIDSNGNTLQDGNFVRVVGTVEDVRQKHESIINPLLTTRCKTNGAGFFPNLLNILHYLTGITADACVSDRPALVTETNNAADENRLVIDEDKVLQIPTLECTACLNIDKNNTYLENLEQELFCSSWYTFNEAAIDRFDLTITNSNSDLSKDEKDAQFIKFSVPFELLVFNDLSLMKQAAALDGTEPNTIGDLIFDAANLLFTGIANPLIEIPEGQTAAGIVTNTGFDCNFSKPLTTTNIDGMLFYKIKGLKVLNKQDLIINTPELEPVAPVDLIEFMNHQGIRFQKNQVKIEVFASDMIPIIQKDVNSPLIIDVPFDQTVLRKENINTAQKYETIPSTLKFDILSDLIYSNERKTIRRFVPITITAIITQVNANVITETIQAFTDFFTNPLSFLVANWFGIFILAITVLFIAVVFQKFKTGQSIIVDSRK